MPRPKRDLIETPKMRIMMHFYCLIAGIERTGPELALFVENDREYGSKWHRLKEGTKSPQPETYANMIKALEINNVSKSKVKEFTQLFNSPFWLVLQGKEISEQEESRILNTLPLDIQKSLTKRNTLENRLYIGRTVPSEKRVNKLEKISTLDALASLILLLRLKRGQKSNFEDVHIHSAVFRMLLSFFHHPSFLFFIDELWPYIQSVLIKHDKVSLTRMGIGFWNDSVKEVITVLREEAEIHYLARNANIIEDYSDIPSFNYLFYQNKDSAVILAAMKSIANNNMTDMNEVDIFSIALKNLRRKGKSNLNFPSLSFPQLRIE